MQLDEAWSSCITIWQPLLKSLCTTAIFCILQRNAMFGLCITDNKERNGCVGKIAGYFGYWVICCLSSPFTSLCFWAHSGGCLCPSAAQSYAGSSLIPESTALWWSCGQLPNWLFKNSILQAVPSHSCLSSRSLCWVFVSLERYSASLLSLRISNKISAPHLSVYYFW